MFKIYKQFDPRFKKIFVEYLETDNKKRKTQFDKLELAVEELNKIQSDGRLYKIIGEDRKIYFEKENKERIDGFVTRIEILENLND